MSLRGCFPTRVPFSPLRLASNYRDYYGDPHAKLTELIDPFLEAACYVPRIYHAPDTETETVGLDANGYLEYVLAIPAGSFLLGFLHTFTGLANPGNASNPPVGSSFRFQLTDVERSYRFFDKPIPEAFLLNDIPSFNPEGLTAPIYVLNPSPRLLPAPYPVAPPGVFKVEFWNVLNSHNPDVRLSLVAAVPNPDLVEV